MPHSRFFDKSSCLAATGMDAICVCCGGWTPGMLDMQDHDLRGLAGQLCLATSNKNPISRGKVHLAKTSDGSRPVYSVSVSDEEIWLGGTAFPAEFTSPDQNIPFFSNESQRMQFECREMLGGVDLQLSNNSLNKRKGIRPLRKKVRVEMLKPNDRVPICVNYGHGGSGVTLAWGCASDAVALLEDATGNASVAQSA